MSFDIGLILKIIGVGILTSVSHYVLKHSGKEDFAFTTTLCGLGIVLFWVVQLLGELFNQVKSVFNLY